MFQIMSVAMLSKDLIIYILHLKIEKMKNGLSYLGQKKFWQQTNYPGSFFKRILQRFIITVQLGVGDMT